MSFKISCYYKRNNNYMILKFHVVQQKKETFKNKIQTKNIEKVTSNSIFNTLKLKIIHY